MAKNSGYVQKKIDLKTTLILIISTFTLVSLFAESLTGNYYIAPGKIADKKFYINKEDYLSAKEDSQCKRVGGIIVKIGQKVMFKEKIPIEILSISENTVLIRVNGARRAMEIGWEKYVGGLYVTVFATGNDDTCLIVRDWYKTKNI